MYSTIPDGTLTTAVYVNGQFDLGVKVNGAFGLSLEFNKQFPLWEQDKHLFYNETAVPGIGYCIAKTEDGIKSGAETDVDCGGPTAPACGIDKMCKVLSDCTVNEGWCKTMSSIMDPNTGVVTDLRQCQPLYCTNGALDPPEADVDCGLYCPNRCKGGQKCAQNQYNCEPGYSCDTTVVGGVVTSKCNKATCTNGTKDHADGHYEIGVDCGGPCKPCPVGSLCWNDADCATGKCVNAQIGVSSTGGAIAGYSVRYCAPVGCKSVVVNGSTTVDTFNGNNETDIDCGGPCAVGPKPSSLCSFSGCGDKAFKCKIFQHCQTNNDCISGNCVSGTCQQDDCSNKKQDGNETDIDCGGACPGALSSYYAPLKGQCDSGQKCQVDGDCFNPQFGGQCSAANTCVYSPCADGKLDTNEGDVDCGAVCNYAFGPDNRCKVGKTCQTQADCASGLACGFEKVGSKVTRCMACIQDGIQNGKEAGVDCGGACVVGSAGVDPGTGKCAIGGACTLDTDCQPAKMDTNVQKGWTLPMGWCDAGTCKNPCQNGKKDLGETDVDCGVKACLTRCKLGDGCATADDCPHDWQTKVISPLSGNAFPLVNRYCDPKTKTCNDFCLDGKPDYLDSGSGQFDSPYTDCGGPKCGGYGGCPVGAGCTSKFNYDCKSLFCKITQKGQFTQTLGTVDIGKCAVPGCDDGVQNGKEMGIDCGGACAKGCPAGTTCLKDKHSDCKSANCEPNKDVGFWITEYFPWGKELVGVCKAGYCENGEVTASPEYGETDIDCGGPVCDKCAWNKLCKMDTDCQTGQCVKQELNWTWGQCGINLCLNGKLDIQGETGIDCGGPCPKPCGLGGGCAVGSDCASGWCGGGKCAASACVDLLQSTGESDVDCGGKCALKCAVGKKCKTPTDCASGFCHQSKLLCVATVCEDGKKSASEAFVDCGGICPKKCANDAGCKQNVDCQSGICNTLKSKCSDSDCSDGVKTGTESDVDCGGGCAQKCATGAGCKLATECASGICSITSKCVVSVCSDGKLSGDETAVDCGGACATKCTKGLACKIDGDCASQSCTAGKCGSTCENLKLSTGETDVDCGGPVCGTCVVGKVCKANADCGSGSCAGGLCKSVCDPTKCGDSDPCTIDGCSTAGVCENKLAPDGSICGTLLACAAGKCGPHCNDGKKSGSETDVDCGGGCGKCYASKECANNLDCWSNTCVSGGNGKQTCLCGRGQNGIAVTTGAKILQICAPNHPAWGMVPEVPKTLTATNGGTTITDSKTGLVWQSAVAAIHDRPFPVPKPGLGTSHAGA